MGILKRISSVVLVFSLALSGCSQADSNKSIDGIKTEVEGMSVSQLESKAIAYAKEISNKTGDMDQVKKKLAELSPKDLLGEKAKEIKNDLSSIDSEIGALTKRYNIYADQFKKLGGDVAKIKI